MKKKIKYILLVIGVLLITIIGINIYSSKNNNIYSFNIIDKKNGYYYSDGFSVNKSKVKISSNIDTSIDIVNELDDNDYITIGYLTSGLPEIVELDTTKKYRIRVKENSDSKLNITISNIKETWTICYTEKVSLSIKEETLSKDSVTIILKNNTDEEYTYGPDYYLEKYVDSKWINPSTITGDPLTWNSIAYSLKPNESKEITIDFTLAYGKLSVGKYRIIKRVSSNKDTPITEDKIEKLIVEFSIDK